MVLGLLLIAFGVLVAVLPQILVALVSILFIMAGLVICLTSWHFRRLRRHSDVPFFNWMIRF
ncbi:MAG: hypothetical protein HYZ92_00775 [Candidatus Omnitrophica bacterium]|nr:hypothetical protein [Candidatus Omnitrophota bacterium]